MTQPLSSGRWDASGSWEEAVANQMDEAVRWAWNLSDLEILESLRSMAEDTNALTLYQRKALLLLAVGELEIHFS